MGDPRKLKKRYATPSHPWHKAVIEAESVLVKEFGLAKKREIYSANAFIKKYRALAKNLIVNKDQQTIKEKAQIIGKLQKLGLISANAEVSDILSLETKDILERRLQTRVYKLGLARSMKQARQFITHRHIFVGNKEITSPSYLTSVEDDSMIAFKEKSSLFSIDHPERVDPNQDIKEEVASIKSDVNTEEVKSPEVVKETKTKEVKAPEVIEETKKEEVKAPEVVEETKKEEVKTPEEKSEVSKE